MQKKSYTLSELIFTVAVGAVLLSSTAVLVSNEQHKAMSSHCLSNLKASAQAMSAYAADNKGFYLLYMHDKATYQKKQTHVSWGFWMTKLNYLQDERLLICPAGDPDGVSSKNNRFQLHTYGVLVASEFTPYYRGTKDRNVRTILGAKTTPGKTIMLIDSYDPKNGKQSYSYQYRFKGGQLAQQRHDEGIQTVDFSGTAKALLPAEFAADLAVDCRRTSVKPKQAFYADADGRVQSLPIPY